MEEAFRDYLLASAGLVALVGERVAWGALPRKGAMPSLSIHLAGGGLSYTSKGAIGLRKVRVQIDCWGANYLQARDLALAVVAACGAPAGQIRGVFINDIGADWSLGDGPRADGSRDFFQHSLDAQVVFKPA